MLETVDLFWTTPGGKVDGETVSAGAVWHLPRGRQGYVDVYEPHALDGVQRLWLALPAGEKRLGRWIEDETTKPAFDLARQGAERRSSSASQRPARARVYSKKTELLHFTSQGQELLDRATILMTRSIIEGAEGKAVQERIGRDKPFEAPLSQEQSKKAAEVSAQIKEAKPSLWERTPTAVKAMGAAAVGVGVAWLLG